MKDLLPIPHPLSYNPAEEDPLYFYNNVTKPLIKPFIRLMQTGLVIDDHAVESLRTTIDSVLTSVTKGLAANPIIIDYQKIAYSENKAALIAEQESKCRTLDYYIKPYNRKNVLHNTYVINTLLNQNGLSKDKRTKWTINDIKKYKLIYNHQLLDDIINNTVQFNNPIILTAMKQLAQTKLDIYNKSKMQKVEEATLADLAPPFNPGSSLQKKKLFNHLGIPALKFSKKTGDPTWGREQIEEIKRVTPAENTDLHNLLQLFIDYSYAGIIKANFLEAFDTFTIDDSLKGNYRLLGAKSGRPTSNGPNMLNAPSTGSIYSKPLKKCFIAPPGYRVWSIDYSALNVMLQKESTYDENKQMIVSSSILPISSGVLTSNS